MSDFADLVWTLILVWYLYNFVRLFLKWFEANVVTSSPSPSSCSRCLSASIEDYAGSDSSLAPSVDDLTRRDRAIRDIQLSGLDPEIFDGIFPPEDLLIYRPRSCLTSSNSQISSHSSYNSFSNDVGFDSLV